VRRLTSAGVVALLAAWTGTAWAQAGAGDRPTDQDIFGGTAPKPPPPAAPDKPAAPAQSNAASSPQAPSDAQAGPPGPNQPGPGTPPAAAAEDREAARDTSVLGATGETQHLSDYQAPDNPLQIGGQIYLRAQSTGYQNAYPDKWTLATPALVDAYFDARPNPRVRAFILGRMSYNATAAPDGSTQPTVNGLPVGGMGAFAGGSPTGFTTFSSTRGPTSVLDQMWIRFDISQRVFVTAGKQHVRWGTGRFWQPTDYLHLLKRNPLDVFDARQGTTMLKLHFPWEDRGWNFYAFGVAEDPNTATPTLRQVAGGARAEIVIGGAEIGLDALVKRDAKPRVGIDFSTGIWDFDIYADVGIRSGEDFNVVEKVPSTTMCISDPNTDPPTTMLTDDLSSQYAVHPLSGIKTQAVGGINYSRKYNDNDLWTVGAEYFYNQPGYTDPSIYPGLLFNQAGTPMLNFFYTGRHYAALFASLPAPYSWNYTTFTFSTLGNLSDMSFVSRLDYSVTLLTHLTFEAFGAVHYGTRGGEFRIAIDVDPATGLGAGGLCAPNPPFPIHQGPPFVDLGVALRMKI
jgi:hypothetical protein